MNRRNLVTVFLLLVLIMIAGLATVQAKQARSIMGSVHFPAPVEWGFPMELWIQFEIYEVNAENHRATGTINWQIYNEDLGWRETKSHPTCVLFGTDVGEDPQTAIVVTRLTDIEGWGEGLPGEYAYWWLRDDDPNDQMAVRAYSWDPSYEFFPRGKPPTCEYFEPMPFDIGGGLRIDH